MNTPTSNSKFISWGGYLAITLACTLVISVLTVRAGLWQQGLVLYAISCAGAAALLLVFAASLLLPVFADRRRALLQRSLWVLPGSLLLLGMVTGDEYPAIHDISTDTVDPPIFVQAPNLRAPSANSLAVEPDTLALQKQAYPDIKTMHTHLAGAAAFAQALAVAEAMGWNITRSDPDEGFIEAVATTRIMAFRDDVIIRLRPAPNGGTLVDLRSVSRVGRSDLGANAKRIREFLARYKS